MTTSEVAKFFSIPVHTVHYWTTQGDVAFFRTPGGQKRFSREVIEAFVPPTRQSRRARRSTTEETSSLA